MRQYIILAGISLLLIASIVLAGLYLQPHRQENAIKDALSTTIRLETAELPLEENLEAHAASASLEFELSNYTYSPTQLCHHPIEDPELTPDLNVSEFPVVTQGSYLERITDWLVSSDGQYMVSIFNPSEVENGLYFLEAAAVEPAKMVTLAAGTCDDHT